MIKYYPQSTLKRRCHFCNKITTVGFTVREGLARGFYDRDACYESAKKQMEDARGQISESEVT